MKFDNALFKPLTDIFERIYLTGGGVIDLIQAKSVKDWDLEVYGYDFEEMAKILTDNGFDFFRDEKWGVIKLKINGVDFDLTVPRTENKIGKGHKGFSVEFPKLTPLEASSRRDFTINSMMIELSTGKLLDPWNGQDHLEKGILKPVNNSRFMEDPIRIFRAANMLARKVQYPDPVLYTLAQKFSETRAEIPQEAIFAELNKVMIGSHPSKAFEYLERAGWSWPELGCLKYLNENPVHHPEGDTFTHTMLVIDEAAKLRHLVPGEWQRAYMYGMLLHDVGKAVTMGPTGSAIGHEEAGVEIAEKFLKDLKAPNKLIKQVSLIVKYHMRVNLLHAAGAKKKAYRRLAQYVPLDVLALVARADSIGRLGANRHHPASDYVLNELKDDPVPVEPIFKGRHLIEMGHLPGTHFSNLLKRAYEFQLEGLSFEAIRSEMKTISERL